MSTKMLLTFQIIILLQFTVIEISGDEFNNNSTQVSSLTESNESSKSNVSDSPETEQNVINNKTGEFYSEYINRDSNSSVMTTNTRVYSTSVPSSFAILVNFGIDGRKRMLYSSNANAHVCSDKQIWDPFNQQCRQLYCSAHFTMVGLKCVETNNATTNMTRPDVSILDSESEYVNITLGFTLEEPVPDTLKWIDSHKNSFKDEFRTQFATYFANTSLERIVNVTYVGSKDSNKFDVNFILLEGNISDSNTVNNDYIVAVMSTSTAQNGLSFRLYDNSVKAYSVHTTISEFKTFCTRDSDMPIWYWNNDFTMITEKNITYLFVNETGRKYRPGQYMGNILYVQNIKIGKTFDTTPNRFNVSSNAVVCETQTLINESCPRILLNHKEYEWISDGNKLRTKSGQIHDHFELAPNRSVFICFIPEDSGFVTDMVEAVLSTVLIIISILALTCVLVTYIIFAKFRSTLNGFNTINLALCLQLMQILFLASQCIMNCRTAAIVLHYFVLATMSWSSVIAYDMYRTFGCKKVMVRHKTSVKLRLIYWFTAYTSAAVIIIISSVSDIYDTPLAPDYGHEIDSSACWIRNPLATFVYFGLPLTINIVVNLALYLMTVCQVRIDLKTSNGLRKISRIPSDSSNSSNSSSVTSRTTSSASLSTTASRPNQVVIFTRLGVLMGFTWIIALIIAFIPVRYELLLKALSYIFVICNTSQGVVLFIAFLCNSKVLKLWKNLICRQNL